MDAFMALLGSVCFVLVCCYYPPSIYKAWKTRSMRDYHLSALWMQTVGLGGLWVTTFYYHVVVYMVGNGFSFLASLCLLVLYYIFRQSSLAKSCANRALIGLKKQAVCEEVKRVLKEEIFPKLHVATDLGEKSVTVLLTDAGYEMLALSAQMTQLEFQTYVFMHIARILSNDLGFRTEYRPVSGPPDSLFVSTELVIDWS